jgi:hypothetical protein
MSFFLLLLAKPKTHLMLPGRIDGLAHGVGAGDVLEPIFAIIARRCKLGLQSGSEYFPTARPYFGLADRADASP